MKRWNLTTTQVALLVGTGVLAGILLLVGIRFFNLKDPTHYHANFAIYVSGEREQFAGPGFYEEVVSCDFDSGGKPADRAHMHDNTSDVVHVHDDFVTWGQFLANIGYSVSPDHLQTTDAVYSSGSNRTVSFILNGEPVNDVANRVIGNEDRLLISYGAASETVLQQQYNSIDVSAHEHNQSTDPGACGAEAERGWQAKFKQLFF